MFVFQDLLRTILKWLDASDDSVSPSVALAVVAPYPVVSRPDASDDSVSPSTALAVDYEERHAAVAARENIWLYSRTSRSVGIAEHPLEEAISQPEIAMPLMLSSQSFEHWRDLSPRLARLKMTRKLEDFLKYPCVSCKVCVYLWLKRIMGGTFTWHAGAQEDLKNISLFSGGESLRPGLRWPGRSP